MDILLVGEVEFLDVFNDAYSNVMRYARGQEGYWVSQAGFQLPRFLS